MRLLTTLISFPMVACLTLTSSAFAQDHHVVDPAALAGAVADHAAAQDKDRQAVREVLERPEIRDVASKAGLDLTRAAAAVETMSGPDLERAAALAREANTALVGGANSVTLSTTTIIIILLVVILIVVAVK